MTILAFIISKEEFDKTLKKATSTQDPIKPTQKKIVLNLINIYKMNICIIEQNLTIVKKSHNS